MMTSQLWGIPYGVPYGLAQTSAPSSEPVTLAEAKAWLRQDFAEDDALLITPLIKAARQRLEQETGLAFMSQSWRLSLDGFPPRQIELPRTPLAGVTSITYVDPSGNSQTMSSSLYEVNADVHPGHVIPVWGEFWPAIRYQSRAVQVVFSAGYNTAADVPEPLKAAIKVLVAHLYANNGEMAADVPEAAMCLVAPYLDGRVS